MFGTRKQLRQSTRRGHMSFGLCLATVGLLFSGFCFLNARPGSSLRAKTQPSATSFATASQSLSGSIRYRTKNIEDIRVGDRVLADNPDVDSASGTQVDPATWRKLRLRTEETWDDGTLDDINVETLQPLEWIEHVGARTGSTVPIPVDLTEMGLPEDLQVEVMDIELCPALKAGQGRVVLATVNHLNRYMLELTVQAADGRAETIRPTDFHKFYRPTDRAWVDAEDLRPGDTLYGLHGTVTVVSTRRLPDRHRVYNMTVEGEHVYYAGTIPVLVHNFGCSRPRPGRPSPGGRPDPAPPHMPGDPKVPPPGLTPPPPQPPPPPVWRKAKRMTGVDPQVPALPPSSK